LGLNLAVEKDKEKVYPKSWCQVNGRVLVDEKRVKSGIVGENAKRIGQSRKW